MLIAEHCVVVALGVDAEGRKQPLGLWEGSTENKTLCNALLANLIDRGLDPEQVRLFVIDGSSVHPRPTSASRELPVCKLPRGSRPRGLVQIATRPTRGCAAITLR